MGKVVDTLISYITHFCFTSERRSNLGEQARNRTFVEAKRLFRNNPTTGQPGELLVYFLIEAVLQAPQILKKMLITTNPNDERKGSDGVHIRWANGELLEVIFAEAKLYKDFAAALASAFVSMTDFHNSTTKELEINYFLNTFSLLNAEQQAIIASYVDGENKHKCQQVHVCLVGYNWDEYECLESPEKKKMFLEEFDSRYRKWALAKMKPKLDAELAAFSHSHLRCEFFFLPFTSVENFRKLFLASL